MSIPLEVLQKWSKPGKNEMSKQTFAFLKSEIHKGTGIPESNIYLQGSYGNSTNVRDNSDIDIVVEFDSDCDVHNIKQYLFDRIQNIDGLIFTVGNKTIKFAGKENIFVPADIVPCVLVSRKNKCVEIYDSSRDLIIRNYPKLHAKNGRYKSGKTSGRYKQCVRMFKNARNYLNNNGCNLNISSYLIECLLYNVPDEIFQGNESKMYCNVVTWLDNNDSKLDKMKCQDGHSILFGAADRSVKNTRKFIDMLRQLWNEWGNRYR